MKIVKPLVCLALSATSFGTVASSEQLLGAWQCSSVLPISWLDALSIYSPDGSFKGVANSVTQTNVNDRVVEFDLYADGSWSLNGNVLVTDIESIEVIPKNLQAEKGIEAITEAVNQPSILHSELEVTLLTRDSLQTKSKDGVVDNCRRVISASELKSKSEQPI
ncbi:hypothetical protein [Vibrio hepatarius]|uniref:hypothetical protein n=1 Tax=Vibrio hepatarius TaxID=171383 RepID=UPI00142E0081|nr:hypothetical protein [Vibrio hepatarius]NIY83683.1 hypothetical protein [Vibrio hepatarius]